MESRNYRNYYQEQDPCDDYNQPLPTDRESDYQPLQERYNLSRYANSGSTNNVIRMSGASGGGTEVFVMEPQTFAELPLAIRSLRQNKTVLLNLTKLDADQAQRAVDFVAGGTYAFDGYQKRIGDGIFLFTPNCVQINNTKEEKAPDSANRGCGYAFQNVSFDLK